MAKLDLQVPTHATAGISFSGTVSITSGPPAAVVTITVEQPRGLAPLYVNTQNAHLDFSGAGSAVFNIKLSGEGFNTLLTHGTDAQNTFYKPDADTVEVL